MWGNQQGWQQRALTPGQLQSSLTWARNQVRLAVLNGLVCWVDPRFIGRGCGVAQELHPTSGQCWGDERKRKDPDGGDWLDGGEKLLCFRLGHLVIGQGARQWQQAVGTTHPRPRGAPPSVPRGSSSDGQSARLVDTPLCHLLELWLDKYLYTDDQGSRREDSCYIQNHKRTKIYTHKEFS